MLLPVSFVHRDKTYNPVVDQEELADNDCSGTLPNPPQGTKIKTERDTKPQCVISKDEADSQREYEPLDLIMYVALCFKCSDLAENCCEKCVCMCMFVYVYVCEYTCVLVCL